MPPQPRPAPEALTTRRTAKASRRPTVDPLVALQDAGEAEGLPTRRTGVLLFLRVDSGVVSQSHGVAEGLGAEGAAEVTRLVRVLVVQQRAGVAVAAVADVAHERPLLLSRRPGAAVSGQRVCRQEVPLTVLASEGSGPEARPACSSSLSKLSADVSQQLLLPSEPFPTVLAQVLLVRKVAPQVILHRQLVRVNVSTDGAVIFAGFMRVPVVDQTSCVAVAPTALLAGERSLLVLRLLTGAAGWRRPAAVA